MIQSDLDRIKRSFEATSYLLASGSAGPDVTEKVMYAQDVGCLLTELQTLTVQRDGWTDECFLLVQQRDEARAVLTELWACRDAETQEELRRLDRAWKKIRDILCTFAEPAPAPSAAPGAEE